MSEVSLREYIERLIDEHEARHAREQAPKQEIERHHERRHEQHEKDIGELKRAQSRSGGMWAVVATGLGLLAGLASGIVTGVVAATR